MEPAEEDAERPLISREGEQGEQGDEANNNQPSPSPQFLLTSWPLFCCEVDTCCGCCDLQVGAKVIAIMGVVQGLTNSMSISTAGFLAAPTLLIGCLSVGFSLYGFWGAQSLDKRKVAVHFYWLLISTVLLTAVSIARIMTSQQFCSTHNCVIDHLFYPNTGGAVEDSQGNAILPPDRVFPTDKFLQENGLVLGGANNLGSTNSVNLENSDSDGGFKPNVALRTGVTGDNGSSGGHAHHEAIPIYREPCYVEDGMPSQAICTKAHQLSALTTITAAVPLAFYFSFIIQSLYKKIVEWERQGLPVGGINRSNTPMGRPVQIASAIPPMTVYEARSLDGTPVSGRYLEDKGEEELKDRQSPSTPDQARDP